MMPNVKIIAILTALPGKSDELKTLLDGMVEASRSEPGNLRYDLWRDQAEASRFVLDELYVDDEAVASHRASPYFQHYMSVINTLAERSVAVLVPIAVA